jgi:P-type E1-E2 ATPase
VEYLFCDKTGTLTENVMQFKQCSVNGALYKQDSGSGQFVPHNPNNSQSTADQNAAVVTDQVDGLPSHESVQTSTTVIDQLKSVCLSFLP